MKEMNKMEITVLCVDDDQHAIDALKGHLSFYSFIKVVGEVNDGVAALAFLKEHEVDLMFLDIEMNGMKGIQLAQHIKKLYPTIMIVFVTGHAGFALEGYEADPVDFLIKPVNVRRLDRVLEKVQQRKQIPERTTDEQIGMKVDGGIRIVNVEDILYILICQIKRDKVFLSTCAMKHSIGVW